MAIYYVWSHLSGCCQGLTVSHIHLTRKRGSARPLYTRDGFFKELRGSVRFSCRHCKAVEGADSGDVAIRGASRDRAASPLSFQTWRGHTSGAIPAVSSSDALHFSQQHKHGQPRS